MNPHDVAPLVATVFITVAATLVAIVWLRTRSRPAIGSAELKEIVTRLDRMEQAIDAMAVETERISEGQRFTTKLLNERAGQPTRRE